MTYRGLWRQCQLTASVLALGAWFHSPEAVVAAQADLRAVAHTIGEIASSGNSAGVIVRLPTTPKEGASPFDAFLDLDRRGSRPLEPGVTVERILADRFGAAAIERADGGPVLADRRAVTCNRLLDQPVVLTGEGGMFQTVVHAVNQITGQSVPDGAMGSCMPVAFTRQGFRASTPPGSTLKQVLSRAAALEPGSVWVAVEAPDGSCTFGMVLKGEHNRTCRVQIGEPVK